MNQVLLRSPVVPRVRREERNELERRVRQGPDAAETRGSFQKTLRSPPCVPGLASG